MKLIIIIDHENKYLTEFEEHIIRNCIESIDIGKPYNIVHINKIIK